MTTSLWQRITGYKKGYIFAAVVLFLSLYAFAGCATSSEQPVNKSPSAATTKVVTTGTAIAQAQATEVPMAAATANSSTESPSPSKIAIITASVLNVRRGPGTNYAVVAKVKKGDKLTMLARDNTGSWVKVNLASHKEAWISSHFISTTVVLSTLNIAQTIATPDTRSPFEKCVDSRSGVRYVITGESVTGVSLTWQNDRGGTDQGNYKIPFCNPYSGFESGDFLYISAQIIQPTSGAGSIKCYIYDDNWVIAEANASGFAAIATCSGSAK